jgi:peptidoglycan-associated lipoprotein
MRDKFLVVFGTALLACTAACAKKAPVAKALDPVKVPIEQRPEAPKPPEAKVRPQQQAASQPAPAQTQRPATLSAKDRATLNEHLARLEDALFDYDKANIRADATVALREDVNVIRDILSNYPAQKLVIEGHADQRGSEEYNLALGDRRATAAHDFLGTMGVPAQQLSVISYGKNRPVCTDESESCWQRNRRVHITAAP